MGVYSYIKSSLGPWGYSKQHTSCTVLVTVILPIYYVILYYIVSYHTSRMQASGEQRRVLHRQPWLCIVPFH